MGGRGENDTSDTRIYGWPSVLRLTSEELCTGRVGIKTSIAILLLVMLAACSSISTSSPRIVARASGPPTSPTSTSHPKRTHPSSKPPPSKPSSGPASSRPPITDRNIPRADLPRHMLTPGVALAVGRARVCTPGYASATRDVSDAEKAAVYNRYGVVWVPYQHEVDHLISLELGGSNAIRNLWPEPYAGRWGARTKDVLENRLHDLVCEGRLTLRSAQRQEAGDWVAAYRKYVGSPTSGGNGVGGPVVRRLLRVQVPNRVDHLLRGRPCLARIVTRLLGAFRHVRPGQGALPRIPPSPTMLRLHQPQECSVPA